MSCLATLLALVACLPRDRPLPPKTETGADCVDSDGYNDPYNSGPIFWEDKYELALPSEGIDLDGDGTIDTALNQAWGGRTRELINAGINGAIQSDRTTTPFEVAGLCPHRYHGADPAVTLKLYIGMDADDDRTNNWCAGPGCGEVLIDNNFMVGDQPKWRATPAQLVDSTLGFELETTEPMLFDQDMTVPLQMYLVHGRMTVPETLTELRDGLLCGVVPARDLAETPIFICVNNPEICILAGIPPDRTLAEDLRLSGYLPDIDLDGDGLETFNVGNDGKIDICFDGDGSILGSKDCMQDPEMQDGYSGCFTFHATRATIVGIMY